MANVTVIGSQWGDEGKGKIVDWLSERADIVVRFQGGHNAGHTLVVDGITYKLSLLPSGIVRDGKISVIGNGVVINPFSLLEEIKKVQMQGVKINIENLKIAENATVILSIHSEADNIAESVRSSKIGTTKRGIGPAYEDKVARRNGRICDLADEELLRAKIRTIIAHYRPIFADADKEIPTEDEIVEPLLKIAPEILKHAIPVWRFLDNEQKKGNRILFEGAQGIMLDVDFGTYPFVTSSNTVAGAAAVGSGISPANIGFILGITKAYTTRVGSGPFPTEQSNKIGELLGKRGCEFGTVTGRARRCGWFDAVMVRQAIKISGINGIALTKLDILDKMKELKICVGYEYDGKKYDYLPSNQNIQAKIKPIYENIEGWNDTTNGAKTWAELPAQAIKYVKRLEELIECPVTLLSTSPKREDTILVKDPFAAS